VPEDTSSASQQSGALRAKKIRIWVRRLRSADKYEAKHGASASSNSSSSSKSGSNGSGNGNGNGNGLSEGRDKEKDKEKDKDKEGGGKAGKRFGEVDWIRCSSPSCGKWRACLRSSSALKIRSEHKVCMHA
jgi:hypothetical protein